MPQDPYLPDGCKQADIDRQSMSDRQQEVAEDTEATWMKVKLAIDELARAQKIISGQLDVLEHQRITTCRMLIALSQDCESDQFRRLIAELADKILDVDIETPFFDLSFPTLRDAIDDAVSAMENDHE